jgi:predicted dithiol-disulfide oxidoreductase (DUF899 family)
MTNHKIVDREECQAGREELLLLEEKHTRVGDELVTEFALEDGMTYQTYATTARGVEFVMPYYSILDRVPNGRDEGDAFQTWLRRRDEYV